MDPTIWLLSRCNSRTFLVELLFIQKDDEENPRHVVTAANRTVDALYQDSVESDAMISLQTVLNIFSVFRNNQELSVGCVVR